MPMNAVVAAAVAVAAKRTILIAVDADVAVNSTAEDVVVAADAAVDVAADKKIPC